MKNLVLCALLGICICLGETLENLEKQKLLLEQQIKEKKLQQEQERLQREIERLKQEQEELKQKQQNSQNSQEKKEEAKEEKPKSKSRSGFLFGIGLGGLSSSYQTPTRMGLIKFEPLLSFMFNLSLGQSWMLNDYFGIEHYGNLEVDYGNRSPWKVLSLIATYNVNMIISANNNPKWRNALILGVGGGGRITGFSLEPNSVDTRRGAFEVRVNVGVRTMFARKYALDFMLRFPLLMQESGYYFTNSNYQKEFLKYKDLISFGLNFTLATF